MGLVGFLAPGGASRLAGTAVEPGLDVGLRERRAGWAAIDDAAGGGAVALAQGGRAEQASEAVVRHQAIWLRRGSAWLRRESAQGRPAFP